MGKKSLLVTPILRLDFIQVARLLRQYRSLLKRNLEFTKTISPKLSPDVSLQMRMRMLQCKRLAKRFAQRSERMKQDDSR